MTDADISTHTQADINVAALKDRRPRFHHILACVDASPFARSVLAHAASIAEIMGARLTVMQVLDPSAADTGPADPVEWDLRRADAQSRIAQLLKEEDGILEIESSVVIGSAPERICAWAGAHDVDLTVMGARGESSWSDWGLGGTVRRVAESIASSVLIVPDSAMAQAEGAVRYRRLMVPLDSSSRAECVLPIAIRLAEGHNAEMLLVHAVPDVAFTNVGPLEQEDIELRDRLRQRNEHVAQQYLGRMRAKMPLTGAPAHIRLLPSGDVRHALARVISDAAVDIVVLSCCGLSGHPDLSIGSTADYLIGHATTPILLVRSGPASRRAPQREAAVAPRSRLPGQTLS